MAQPRAVHSCMWLASPLLAAWTHYSQSLEGTCCSPFKTPPQKGVGPAVHPQQRHWDTAWHAGGLAPLGPAGGWVVQPPALPQLVSRGQIPAGQPVAAQAEASQMSSELQGEATQDSAGTQPASKGAKYQVRPLSATANTEQGAQAASARQRCSPQDGGGNQFASKYSKYQVN